MIFFIVDCLMKNIKENEIWLKLVWNLYIFKLFNIHTNELKWNETSLK